MSAEIETLVELSATGDCLLLFIVSHLPTQLVHMLPITAEVVIRIQCHTTPVTLYLSSRHVANKVQICLHHKDMTLGTLPYTM